MLFVNRAITTVKSRVLSSAASVGLVIAFSSQFATAQASEMDLGTALINVASEANLEILFSPEVVEKYTVPVQKPEGEPKVMLSELLRGTGLEFEETSPKVFVVKEKETAKPNRDQTETPMTTGAAKIKPTKMAQVSPAPSARTAQSSAPAPTGGPAGTLEGVVTFGANGAPLAGALVYIEGTTLTATTNSRGEYRFPVAPAGRYTLIVDYLGTAVQTSVVDINSNRKSTQNFQMASSNDQIIVTGQRSSLMQALNQQRAADNTATIVSADLMGSFPAETIAEALRRVSGVSFERNDASGEGSRINVRGFNSEAINIQLNGLDLQGTGIERGIDLTGFLTENISQVTIQKSLLPSHEADGSGGIVEIETKSGLDYGDAFFAIGAEVENTLDKGFGNEKQYTATGAYKFGDNFGVAASIQYRDTRRDNYSISYIDTLPAIQAEGRTSIFSTPFSNTFPFDPELDIDDYQLIGGANYSKAQRDEKNLTGSLNFALDVSDHTTLRLDLQRIEAESDLKTPRATLGFLTGATNFNFDELGGETRRRTYIRSLRPTLSATDEITDLKTTSIGFRGDTNLDAWDFDYKVGYTKSERQRESSTLTFLSNQRTDLDNLIRPSSAIFAADTAGNQRIIGGAVGIVGDRIPSLNLSNAGVNHINDPDAYYLISGSAKSGLNTSETYLGELKIRRSFDNPNLDYIEIGGKYDDVIKFNSSDLLSATTNLGTQFSISRVRNGFVFVNTTLSQLAPNALTTQSLADIGGMGSIPQLGIGTNTDILNAAIALTEDDPNTPFDENRFVVDRRDGDALSGDAPSNPAEVTEETFAGYLETKVKFGDLDIVGGVRYERESNTGSTLLTPSIRREDGGFVERETLLALGLVDFVDVGGTQDKWTPSLLATYRPYDRTTARLGYYRSTINPDLRLLVRPKQIFIDLRPDRERVTIREANPDLSPSTSDNFELDLAYYFEDNPGLVRIGAFYKKINNNFTSVLLADDASDSTIGDRVREELAPLFATNPEFFDFPDDTQFFLQRPRNGEGGSIYGAEFEIIRHLDFFGENAPAFLENFSVLANLTYTTSDFPFLETARDDNNQTVTLSLDRPFLRQSEWAGNASLRYEDDAFGASVIYTHQSASAKDFDEFNLNSIIPKFSTLDARMSYTIEDGPAGGQLILFAEGDDLLNGAKDADVRSGIGSQFGDGNVDYFFPDAVQFSGGRTVTIGAKMRF